VQPNGTDRGWATVLPFMPKRGISPANFFSRVGVCENELYCKSKMGESASYTQAAILSPALYPNLKQHPTQRQLDDCDVLEE